MVVDVWRITVRRLPSGRATGCGVHARIAAIDRELESIAAGQPEALTADQAVGPDGLEHGGLPRSGHAAIPVPERERPRSPEIGRDLGLLFRAGEENRTPVLSLGS